MIKRFGSSRPTVKFSSASSGTMPRVLVDRLIQWTMSLDDPGRSVGFVIPGGRSLLGLSQFITWSQTYPGGANDVFGSVTESWIQSGILTNFLSRVRRMPYELDVDTPVWFPPEPEIWELLWGVVSGREFVVREPLRTIVDQKSYLAHDFYRLLWEVRFLVNESLNLSKAQTLVHNLVKWAFEGGASDSFLKEYGISQRNLDPSQRYDLLWMLLTLAHHNGLFTRYLFGMDRLSEVLEVPSIIQDLETMMGSLERWVRMGDCPIGVLFMNFDASPENLGKLYDASPQVTRQTSSS